MVDQKGATEVPTTVTSPQRNRVTVLLKL